jgi:predicted TIM-barrel fold metal-dependent hydrolase
VAPRPVIALEEHLLPKDVAAAIGVDPAAAFLRDARLSPADKQKIAHGNAERLLRL